VHTTICWVPLCVCMYEAPPPVCYKKFIVTSRWTLKTKNTKNDKTNKSKENSRKPHRNPPFDQPTPFSLFPLLFSIKFTAPSGIWTLARPVNPTNQIYYPYTGRPTARHDPLALSLSHLPSSRLFYSPLWT